MFFFLSNKKYYNSQGGISTSNNFNLIKKVKVLSAHGVANNALDRKIKKFSWIRNAKYFSHNFRMPDPLAAMGITQMNKLKQMNMKRNKIASIYNNKFLKIKNFITQQASPGYYHSYQMYYLIIKNIYKILKWQGNRR